MTERVSRVLSLAVTLSLWAGGLVAGVGILRPLLAGGTATGLQSREVMTGGGAALRIGLADVGDVRTRLLVRVPRSLDGVATFTAHMADDPKPLKVVARAIEPEGRWLEIRSHADSSQGHFLWPAQAELELRLLTSPRRSFSGYNAKRCWSGLRPRTCLWPTSERLSSTRPSTWHDGVADGLTGTSWPTLLRSRS